MVNVFLSWSGEQSRLVAEELRQWLPSVLQFVKPYFSPGDIEKGTRWHNEISQKLSTCDIGIICLTRDNLNKPWILFEAGALSKNVKDSRVCTLLFGVNNADLSGPLISIQSTIFEKNDLRKLVATINEAADENKLEQDTFERVYQKWWPDLELRASTLIKVARDGTTAPQRSDRELLEEILQNTRVALLRENDTGRALASETAREVIAITRHVASLGATHNDTDLVTAAKQLNRIARNLGASARSPAIILQCAELSQLLDTMEMEIEAEEAHDTD